MLTLEYATTDLDAMSEGTVLYGKTPVVERVAIKYDDKWNLIEVATTRAGFPIFTLHDGDASVDDVAECLWDRVMDLPTFYGDGPDD